MPSQAELLKQQQRQLRASQKRTSSLQLQQEALQTGRTTREIIARREEEEKRRITEQRIQSSSEVKQVNAAIQQQKQTIEALELQARASREAADSYMQQRQGNYLSRANMERARAKAAEQLLEKAKKSLSALQNAKQTVSYYVAGGRASEASKLVSQVQATVITKKEAMEYTGSAYESSRQRQNARESAKKYQEALGEAKKTLGDFSIKELTVEQAGKLDPQTRKTLGIKIVETSVEKPTNEKTIPLIPGTFGIPIVIPKKEEAKAVSPINLTFEKLGNILRTGDPSKGEYLASEGRWTGEQPAEVKYKDVPTVATTPSISVLVPGDKPGTAVVRDIKITTPSAKLNVISETERYRDLGYTKTESEKLARESVRSGGMSFTPSTAERIIKGERYSDIEKERDVSRASFELGDITGRPGGSGFITGRTIESEDLRTDESLDRQNVTGVSDRLFHWGGIPLSGTEYDRNITGDFIGDILRGFKKAKKETGKEDSKKGLSIPGDITGFVSTDGGYSTGDWKDNNVSNRSGVLGDSLLRIGDWFNDNIFGSAEDVGKAKETYSSALGGFVSSSEGVPEVSTSTLAFRSSTAEEAEKIKRAKEMGSIQYYLEIAEKNVVTPTLKFIEPTTKTILDVPVYGGIGEDIGDILRDPSRITDYFRTSKPQVVYDLTAGIARPATEKDWERKHRIRTDEDVKTIGESLVEIKETSEKIGEYTQQQWLDISKTFYGIAEKKEEGWAKTQLTGLGDISYSLSYAGRFAPSVVQYSLLGGFGGATVDLLIAEQKKIDLDEITQKELSKQYGLYKKEYTDAETELKDGEKLSPLLSKKEFEENYGWEIRQNIESQIRMEATIPFLIFGTSGLLKIGKGIKWTFTPKDIPQTLIKSKVIRLEGLQHRLPVFTDEGLKEYAVFRDIFIKSPSTIYRQSPLGKLLGFDPKLKILLRGQTYVYEPLANIFKIPIETGKPYWAVFGRVGKKGDIVNAKLLRVGSETTDITPKEIINLPEQYQYIWKNIIMQTKTGVPVRYEDLAKYFPEEQVLKTGVIKQIDISKLGTGKSSVTTQIDSVVTPIKTFESGAGTYRIETGMKDISKAYWRASGKIDVQTDIIIRYPLVSGGDTAGIEILTGGGKKSSEQFLRQMYAPKPIPKPLIKVPRPATRTITTTIPDTLKTIISPVERVVTGLIKTTETISVEKEKEKQLSALISIQGKTSIKTSADSISKEIEGIEIMQIPRQIQPPRLTQVQQTMQITDFSISAILPSVPTSPQPPIPEPTQTRLFPVYFRRKKFLKKKIEDESGHHVYIKKKRISDVPMTREEAHNFGSWVSDNTLAAQFQIRETKQKPQKSRYNIPPLNWTFTQAKFRDYEIRRGKRVPLKNRYIEKAPYRLDTSGEVRKIQVARFLAQEKKKLTQKENINRNLQKAIFGVLSPY